MAPKYKLTYFDLTALGEPIRLLLTYGGIEFEDVRITKEQWPKIKSSMPMGQLPILEIDGKVYNQSLAIVRYLAKKVGLVGVDESEDIEIDMAVYNIDDLRAKLRDAYYTPDMVRRAERYQALENGGYEYSLKRLDAMAANNKGYLANGKLSWADIYFVAILAYLNGLADKNLISGYPHLAKVRNNVMALPAIKNWYKKEYVTFWK